MLAEFEEKQYEQLVNIELTRGHNLLPIGQAQENLCGFDGALWTALPDFWRYLDFPLRWWADAIWFLWQRWPALLPDILPGGISVEEWGEICEEGFNIIFEQLHQIRYNVLVQYKRSEYMRSSRSLEWKYWNQPYYRYKLTEWQLDTLVAMSERLNGRAIVVYAAPSFYTMHDLMQYANQRRLVVNSNFRRALDLT